MAVSSLRSFTLFNLLAVVNFCGSISFTTIEKKSAENEGVNENPGDIPPNFKFILARTDFSSL
jgi:hypothetical protein